MSSSRSKPLMRSIGEFFGHIVHAVRSDPKKKVLRKSVDEKRDGNVILRRTTIEEIEMTEPGDAPHR